MSYETGTMPVSRETSDEDALETQRQVNKSHPHPVISALKTQRRKPLINLKAENLWQEDSARKSQRENVTLTVFWRT